MLRVVFTLLFFYCAACGNRALPVTPLSAEASGKDPDYRVMVLDSDVEGGETAFPDASISWEIIYVFTTPPLPSPTSWNFNGWSDFYVWGDVDFDLYGSGGPHGISNYLYNQVAPELILGNGLDEASSGYSPSWHNHTSWVAQAQYFWQNSSGTPYAMVGEILPTAPGETVTTDIYYDASSGQITASINVPAGESRVVIPRPFPNESTGRSQSFSSWRDFFTRAQSVSPGGRFVGRPEAQVETHYVDAAPLCSILPFQLTQFSLPLANGPLVPAFSTQPYGQFSCEEPLSQLSI